MKLSLLFTLAGGTLRLGGIGGDQIYTSTHVQQDGGAFDLNGRSEGFRALLGSGGTVQNSTPATVSALTLGETTVGGDTFTYGGSVTDGAGTTSLVKTGGGTQFLTAASTFTGGTTINAGTLALSGSGALASTGAVALASSTAKLDLSALGSSSTTIGALSAVAGADIDLGTKNLTFGTAVDTTFAGDVIAAVGSSLTKQGAGTFTLAATATFSGSPTLEVKAGMVSLGGDNLLPDASGITLSGGVLSTNGFSDTVGSLRVTAASQLDLAGTSLFNVADSSGTLWTGPLSVTSWSGSLTGGAAEAIVFGNGASALTPAQLAAITFVDPAGLPSGSYPAALLGTGELVPVPEPGTLAIGGLLLALTGRRRRPGRTTAA